jgi:hypothetical protein
MRSIDHLLETSFSGHFHELDVLLEHRRSLLIGRLPRDESYVLELLLVVVPQYPAQDLEAIHAVNLLDKAKQQARQARALGQAENAATSTIKVVRGETTAYGGLPG